jgi:glycosyltransferase involved in cell wall biosynthesis
MDGRVFVTIRLAVVEAGSTGYEETLLPALERRPDLEIVRLRSAPTKELAQELKRSETTVVLATGSDRGGLAAAAASARRVKVPSILRCDWSSAAPGGFLEAWRRRRSVRRFDLALAVGAANRRFLESSRLAAARIEDAPNGVEVASVSSAAAANRPRRRELRESLGIAPDWFCIVFADPLEPAFRPMDVVEALAASRRDHSAHRLLVLGTGSLEGLLREQARDRRLPVTFAARRDRDDFLRAYAAADVVVCPAEGQVTWSTPVAEAMASGLAVIASNAVTFSEDLIEEGVSGFTHALGDTSAIAACLATLAGDPIRAAVMGDAARIRLAARTLDGAIDRLSDCARRLGRGDRR